MRLFSGKRYIYTLLELLVVIAIISLLAGLIVPFHVTSKQQARKIACISNLKQIGTAYHNYTSDHGRTVKIWSSNTVRWMDDLSGYIGENLPICMSDRRTRKENMPSYGINGVLSAGAKRSDKDLYPWYPVQENKIKKPSQFITVSEVADSYYIGNGTDSAAVFSGVNGEFAVRDGFTKNLSFRHDSRNLSFPAALADGHAELLCYKTMPDKYWDIRNIGGYGGGK